MSETGSPALGDVTARAAAFVAERGRGPEKILADALTTPGDGARLREYLVSAQRDDGAFVFVDFDGDPLAGSLFALSALDACADLSDASAATAVAWLRNEQAADGAFALPRAEGDPRVITGLLLGFLAKCPHAHTRMIDAGAAFLADHWSPDVVRSGDLGAIASYAHTFSNLPHEASDEILQWCGRELERALRGGRVHPAQALRVFALCDTQALPGAPSDARVLLPRLLEPGAADAQAADGGWQLANEGAGAGARVSTTMDALVALRRFARLAAFATSA